MGKSATGKDTIYKRLLEEKELNLKTVVMYTTRPIRNGECDGVEYHFVNEETLNKLKDQNKVIEHRFYNTTQGIWHYFTVNDGQINLEYNDYLMIGTLETYLQIREYFGYEKVVPLYLEVDDEARLLRSIQREKKQIPPNFAEVCRRYLADEEDFSESNLEKCGIKKRYKNIDIDQCLEAIIQDMKNITVNKNKPMV